MLYINWSALYGFCRALSEKQQELLSHVRSPYLAVSMWAAWSVCVLGAAVTAARVCSAAQEMTAEHSDGECSKGVTEALLISEQHIPWPEGVWIKTCRRLKINPGVYVWIQVMLEIWGTLWVAVTVSFFSTAITPAAVLLQVMREGRSLMVLWVGRQPPASHWRLAVDIADRQQLAFLVRIQL